MGIIDSTASIPLVQRMIRAAKLESQLYEEVESDQNATNDALMVVIIAAVAAGVGSAIAWMINGEAGRAVGALIGGIITGLLGWVVWSYVTYFIGTRLFSGRATPGELLRTIGFAQSPGVLNVLSFIPVVGGIVQFIVGIWLLVAGVVAVRQALDFDTGKAILTTFLGWLALIFLWVLLAFLGFGALVALG